YLLKSARSLEGAGAFAVVLEKVEANFAKVITDTLFIPTIGIGSGPFCDGQILVVNDILGMFDEFKPRFARQYDDFKSRIKDAASRFAKDVREGKFPEEKESFFEEKR
ncbi:MAG: 3-methyl-2-oxobutanoate hydroxymethyltransferase, partial [candidate division Zixibacteria bacterium 4484_93]